MKESPDYEFERKMTSISLLKYAPYNPRRITTAEFETLKKSIEKWGFVEPVVANRATSHIVGGHMRVRAASKLGLTMVPVVWVDLDEASEKALNIALNKIGGEFDNDMLVELLHGLDDDLRELTGFTDEEIAALQPDPVVDEPTPTAKAGGPQKYSTDELRELAKSYYPADLQTIFGFLAVVDERAIDG